MSARPRILVVEDELLIAIDVEATFHAEGWEVLGPVPSVARALSILRDETPDAACLDMNLNGKSSAEIARLLKARGIPFLILTGYSESWISDPVFQGAPIVRKPFETDDLVATLSRLLR